MNPTEYIQSKLDELKFISDTKQVSNKDVLKSEIFRLLLNKKFRKYSVKPEYVEVIKKAINICVDNNEPIKLTFPFGAYKLWRFEESPEVDWAELFTLIYYTNWLKPICEIYQPGIWFDFYSDDDFVPRLDNIDQLETDRYHKSFINLINFINQYIPDNLEFTFSRVIDQYSTKKEFEEDLQDKINQITTKLNGKMPVLSPKHLASIELNVRATDEQKKDPYWREKNDILHQAYLITSKRRAYYRNVDDKIAVFSTPTSLDFVVVGSTKHSVAKFWVGIGVLEKTDDSFNQIILSPSQIMNSQLVEQKIDIKDLSGKNFRTIKIK